MCHIFLFQIVLALLPVLGGTPAVCSLKTEHLVNPVGIDSTAPRFSWHLDDGRDGAALLNADQQCRVAESLRAFPLETPYAADRPVGKCDGEVAARHQTGLGREGPRCGYKSGKQETVFYHGRLRNRWTLASPGTISPPTGLTG